MLARQAMKTLMQAKTPRTIKLLIYINIFFYIAATILIRFNIDLYQLLGAVPKLIIERYFFWQIFTYMFMHAGIFHLFLNMLMLWMFGVELYKVWGNKFFIKYYLLCGIGGGVSVILLSLADTNMYLVPTVGSSGAIFGLLLAYGITFKNRSLYVFGLFPIKAGKLVIILGIIELFSMFSADSNSSISHIAHLGGLLTGLSYLKLKDLEKKILAKRYLKLKDRYKLHIVETNDDDIKKPKIWN